jgi:radical SAM superfamily enzyme YgiQ (UPF0313 family)
MKFKKILLVQPMHEEKKTKDWDRTSISFPWGLGTLSRFYQKAEYDVEILDGQALKLSKEELLTEFDKLDFDILGITAFSTQYPAVKLFAEYIKKNHNVPIIVGGPLATYQAEMVLATTDVDICVIGEGEISGIIFNKPQDRFVDLDQLPLPDFSLFDMEKYLRHRNKLAGIRNTAFRAMTFITSRGCPYRCHFCSKSSQRFRSMSPNKIYEMIAALKNEFKLEEIYFGDELFLSSKSKFRELAPGLTSLNIPWAGQARVNLVDKEFLELIKATNCVGLGYGVEHEQRDNRKTVRVRHETYSAT